MHLRLIHTIIYPRKLYVPRCRATGLFSLMVFDHIPDINLDVLLEQDVN